MALDTSVTTEKNDIQAGSNGDVAGDPQKRAETLGMPYLDKIPKAKREALRIVSEELAKKYKMAAFEKTGNTAKVCMVEPENFEALNVLRFISENTKLEFEVYLTSKEIFDEILEQYSENAEKAVEDAVKSLKEDKIFDDDSDDAKEFGKAKEETIQDAPVTKLLSVIIKHAIEGKASDIHIEPVDKDYRVRFRVDGVLHSSLVAPKEVGRAVVSRIKILSNLKIDEKRKPQDGRFKVVEGGKRVDFRVSTFPVVDGEKVVMRLLDKDNKDVNIDSLGLMGKSREILERNIRSPYGIILITGPTGSGKSTTLYSFLQILNGEERNIVTLEDPVEYSIEGINQSQVKPEIGYTFANGLRSILRQDPNVIMVGEIRDGETAELTIHAALTGHLVFSTLHTNSSIGAIPRLIDMGIEAFLLSSSLQVVAAQRLVRRICDKCKEEDRIPHAVLENMKEEISKIDKDELKKYGIDADKELKFQHGKGCEVCGETGYKGRVAIYEALEVDDELKEIISEKDGGETYVSEYAAKNGMITIRQDGILKALLGFTTLSEVERVTKGSLSIGGDTDDDKG
ncbi:MAG: Type IV pilus assembly protein PilB [Candidatus Moranbacteria bacterium GW2011_GWE1_49_15]|nr:MAG: Type IV pilus assembly protein PilB [Candidatus Moranbacteria bacterium GW2011_GWE2_47_10]KKW06847.1 MAG: Type IV pilus assembly protein PilB [Candidatus Moranbacteria bacterium GW2011_GWE1_49_15]HBP01357.1 hypothetical protein [Candidatus Moranbacteria bacterium]